MASSAGTFPLHGHRHGHLQQPFVWLASSPAKLPFFTLPILQGIPELLEAPARLQSTAQQKAHVSKEPEREEALLPERAAASLNTQMDSHYCSQDILQSIYRFCLLVAAPVSRAGKLLPAHPLRCPELMHSHTTVLPTQYRSIDPSTGEVMGRHGEAC